MNTRAEMRRARTAKAISDSPTDVTIERRPAPEIGQGGGIARGAFESVGSETVRLFFQKSITVGQDTVVEGGHISPITYGMLCEHDADIKKDDEFSADGRRYLIDSVIPARVAGATVSLQCQIQEMG